MRPSLKFFGKQGQALPRSLSVSRGAFGSVFGQWFSQCMARTKTANVRTPRSSMRPSGGDDSPPRPPPAKDKGKAPQAPPKKKKKLTTSERETMRKEMDDLARAGDPRAQFHIREPQEQLESGGAGGSEYASVQRSTGSPTAIDAPTPQPRRSTRNRRPAATTTET